MKLAGYWQSDKELSVRCGLQCFTLPSQTSVYVPQEDIQRSKVLIEFDKETIDWYSSSWLINNFTQQEI